ncbi:extracellular solute-binding protein [Paeniroseomonas aquatica]|uniref:extracellular solute-binding protein n=1 Tax=Paeniroseomonas aquatica TaxID=373043 RepID=UPI003608B19D
MQPIFGRRQAMALGAGAMAAAAMPARAAIPIAEVPPLRFAGERGARLRVLRPAKYIDPDEAIFNANTRRFTEATGIEVRVDYVNWPDMPVQVAVAANTGQGPDVIIGFGADAHIYADKLLELTDLADYLGAKYGGWYDLAKVYGRKWQGTAWMGLPMGGTTGPVVYRASWVKEAGFDRIPNDLNEFLRLCQGLKRIGHPCGFALSHAPGDAPGYANWLLWSHGGSLVDEEGKIALDQPSTLRALEYSRAMQETMIAGTMGWSGVSNNRAFIGGEVGLTQNGVSVYYALKTAQDAAQNAIAADTDHAEMPYGLATKAPETALTLTGMVPRYTRAPNAAKEYLRFMMEADQYDPWLTGCLGYWSQPLKAYGESAVWSSDPKLAVYRSAMDTPFYEGYRGPITPAAGAVAENGCWSTCSPASPPGRPARPTACGKRCAPPGVGTGKENQKMLTEAQKAEYDRVGAIVVPDVLSAAELAELRRVTDGFVDRARQVAAHDAIYDLEDSHTPAMPRVRRIKSPHLHDPAYAALMTHPKIVAVLQDLWGPDIRFDTAKLNMKSAGFGAAVEWHQDWAFYPHTNDDLAAVGVMMDDMEPANGPLLIIPGSHKGPVHDHHAEGRFCGAMDPTKGISTMRRPWR